MVNVSLVGSTQRFRWILQLSDPAKFMENWEKARVDSLIRFKPRILFLPWNESNYATTLFEAPELNYIDDAVAVELEDADTNRNKQLKLVTNNFFVDIGSKNETTEIYLGVWPLNNSIEIFPNKIGDLQGKELRIATLQYLPYSQVSPELDGVELRILKSFCKQSNCSLVPVTDDFLWGELFENGTSNGIVGNVLQDKADLGVGAVYLWYYDHIEFAYPYMPSRVTVLLPKPSPMPEWRVPLAPFDFALWVALIVSIATVAFVLFYMNHYLQRFSSHHVSPNEFQSWSGVFLRAVGMAVGQSPQNAFSAGSTLRIVFTTFEILFLLYGTVYSSALASVVTVPAYYPPIDNMRQLYASGLPWTADHIAWVKNLMDADEPFIKDLLSKFEVHDQEMLSQLAKKGGYGFTIELTNGGHVSEASFLSADMINNLHVMKEALYYTYSTTIARKGSPYVDELNKLLHKCFDTGLLQLWESDMISKHGSSIIQTAFKLSKSAKASNEHHELVKLKLKHTQGAFILLLLGNTIGTLVFLFEFYCKSMKQVVKPTKMN
uniref:Ionotropic receptor 41a.4 n=1 Tax=Adelphocoris lineolatus TaxID=236346 RepID=A0A2I4PH84_ADELI|nr:ionotropic receptor 41a.4 [Adelphocoris lineolatus]